MMRIAKPVEQGGNPFQAQYIPARGQHGQPVQLRLNGRIGGVGVVGHFWRDSCRTPRRHPELVSGSYFLPFNN